MPVTDEQFERLASKFEKFSELLIRVDENTKTVRKEIDAHHSDDTEKFAINKASIEKAHSRVDVIKDQINRMRNLFVGGTCVATAFISGLQLWIAYHPR